jgi:hypothetical protein
MAYCPQCRAEYREGFTHCPDCDIDLVAELPPELPGEVPSGSRGLFDPDDVPELVTVFTAGVMEAQIVRSLLEASDIPALVRTPGATGAYPVTVGMMGAGEVKVPVDRRDEALEIIASTHHGT